LGLKNLIWWNTWWVWWNTWWVWWNTWWVWWNTWWSNIYCKKEKQVSK